MDKKMRDIVEGALVADAYCLGTHWVYDEKRLGELQEELDWDGFNDPRSQWHPGKRAGELTHYGDQLALFWGFVKETGGFDVRAYVKTWYLAMKDYKGYVDGATRNTIANIKTGAKLPCGAASEELSVAGRISPILAASEDEVDLLEQSDLFARLTHYTEAARSATALTARLLWRMQKSTPFAKAVNEVAPVSGPNIQAVITEARDSRKADTFEVIRTFGPACDVKGALPGALHLLFKYGDDYRTAMVENARAGGDNSARGMLVGMLMVAAHGIDIVPQKWRDQLRFKLD